MPGDRATRLTQALRLGALLMLFCAVAALLLGVQELWRSAGRPLDRDSIARSLLNEGRPLEAAQLLDQPMAKGIAFYRARRYERAAEAFTRENTVEAQYNLGVALARLERFEDAIANFNAVLTRDPNHADAQHNLALLRQIDRSHQSEESRESAPDQDGSIRQTQQNGDESQMRAASEPMGPEEQQTGEDDQSDQQQNEQEENVASLGGGGKGSNDRKARIEQQSVDQRAGDERPDEARSRDTPESERNDEFGPSGETESSLAENVRLRHIVDDPALVLRARLRSAATSRESLAR